LAQIFAGFEILDLRSKSLAAIKEPTGEFSNYKRIRLRVRAQMHEESSTTG